MKAIQKLQRREAARERRKKRKKEPDFVLEWRLKRARKKARAEAKKKRIELKIQKAGSIEYKKIQSMYPKTFWAEITVRKLHPKIKNSFWIKCRSNGHTMGGKCRKFILDCLENKIDHLELENKLKGYDPNFRLGKEKGITLCIHTVPREVRHSFQKWCLLRGYTMAGKLRELILAYVKGYIE